MEYHAELVKVDSLMEYHAELVMVDSLMECHEEFVEYLHFLCFACGESVENLYSAEGTPVDLWRIYIQRMRPTVDVNLSSGHCESVRTRLVLVLISCVSDHARCMAQVQV